jgi:hypothetical protein
VLLPNMPLTLRLVVMPILNQRLTDHPMAWSRTTAAANALIAWGMWPMAMGRYAVVVAVVVVALLRLVVVAAGWSILGIVTLYRQLRVNPCRWRLTCP